MVNNGDSFFPIANVESEIVDAKRKTSIISRLFDFWSERWDSNP